MTTFGVSKTSSGVSTASAAEPMLKPPPEPDGRERLYEAYNDLHALAQAFSKDFDAPAILVVGHQTDGKSGALMLAACCFNTLLAHACLPA